MNYKILFIINTSVNTAIIRKQNKMILPRFIQKWIREQFNRKTVCDRCLERYTIQTIKGELLCSRCSIEQQERSA